MNLLNGFPCPLPMLRFGQQGGDWGREESEIQVPGPLPTDSPHLAGALHRGSSQGSLHHTYCDLSPVPASSPSCNQD